MNVAFEGRLYFSLSEWDTVHNTSIRTLSRIADPSSPVIERLLIFKPDQQVGELLIQNHKVYLVEPNQPYIRVCDSNFKLIDTVIMQKHIYGLTAISHGCDSVTTYACHANYSTAEYLIKGPDTTLYISKYDIESNTLTPIGLRDVDLRLVSCSTWLRVDGRTIASLTFRS